MCQYLLALAVAVALTPGASASGLRGEQKGFVGAMASAGASSMGIGYAKGRGRGRGRAKMYYGPDEFDDSWWTPPPPVGADPFMQGYSSKVSPRQSMGYGGMPKGGFGTTSHFWGGPSYRNPGSQPWWRGRGFSSQPRGGGSPYMPYQTPRDSYGMGQTQPGMGANLPVSSPYYYTPPPLQGWLFNCATAILHVSTRHFLLLTSISPLCLCLSSFFVQIQCRRLEPSQKSTSSGRRRCSIKKKAGHWDPHVWYTWKQSVL